MNECNIETISSNNHLTIRLQGCLTLPNAEKIKTEILQAIDKSVAITIEADNIDDADLSFFQILKALQKHCQSMKIEFDSKISLPTEIKQLFAKASLII